MPPATRTPPKSCLDQGLTHFCKICHHWTSNLILGNSRSSGCNKVSGFVYKTARVFPDNQPAERRGTNQETGRSCSQNPAQLHRTLPARLEPVTQTNRIQPSDQRTNRHGRQTSSMVRTELRGRAAAVKCLIASKSAVMATDVRGRREKTPGTRQKTKSALQPHDLQLHHST